MEQTQPRRLGVQVWKFASFHVAGARPHPHAFLVACLTWGPSPLDHVRSENHVPEGFITFGLRLIFLFFETLK